MHALLWLLIIFGGSVAEFIAEKYDVGITALRRQVERRHRRRLQLKRLELKIAQARVKSLENPPEAASAPKPGPCVHRNVKAVIGPYPEEELVAWLCQCGKQLPPGWAVRAEDL